MEKFKLMLIGVLVSAAVLSCRTSGGGGEEVVIPGNEVTGIEVTATRTVYGLNEVIDLTGLVVTATYEDETVGPYAVNADQLSPAAAIDTASASVPITITVNGYAEVINIAVFPVVSLNAGTYTGHDTLNAAISAVDTGAVITLYADQTINKSTTLSGRTITIQGAGAERKITHTPPGTMFNLYSDNTRLILGENITLDGEGANNYDPLITVSSNAVLVMEDGSTITGGKMTDSRSGGGVSVNNGTFTMNGGTISDNEVNGNGGGVYANNGTFTMNGGTIRDNTAGKNGGGVYVRNSTFTYNAGTFTGNTAEGSGSAVYKDSNGEIDGDGGVTVGGLGDQTYDVFPPPTPQ
jgi:hypothetical protein